MNLEPIYTERTKSEREKQVSYINTYMESRKVVLMNLSARQQWRQTENRPVDTVADEEGGTNWGSMEHTHCRMYNRQLVGICCVMQGAQLSAQWQPGGVGWGSSGRGVQEGVDTCIPMVIHADICRNQHSIVKQLSSN